MNRVTLIGRVGAAPQIRTLTGGAAVASLRIATEERWTKDGERHTRTTWHTVETFKPGTVKFLTEYVDRGDLVLVEGILRYDEFETDGVKQVRSKVLLSGPQHDLKLLKSAKPDGQARKAEDSQPEGDDEARF